MTFAKKRMKCGVLVHKSGFDEHTKGYFNAVPEGEYTNPRKHDEFVRFIAQLDAPERILDVGCGKGDFLEQLGQECSKTRRVGLDISFNMLPRRFEGGMLVAGSIRSRCFKEESFDVVHIDAVLHHLLGSTRKESSRYAVRALRSCVEMLKPGGYLLLAEPTYSPSIVGSAVFWLKKLLCVVNGDRRWGGLGAPIVAFYTKSDLVGILQRELGMYICSSEFSPWSIPTLLGVFGCNRGRFLIIAKKREDADIG